MACEAVAVPVLFRDRAMPLSAPSLSLQAMDAALAPLLDPEPPPESGDEFVLRSSAHSPVLHALLRARLDPAQIHGVLLCGSSSLLPQVQDSLRRRFPDAEHALLGDAEDLQGAMARGAALQALSLQVLGEPVLAPVASCDVALKLDSGEVALCRAGDAVPSTGPASTLLRPPRDSSDGVDIAVELQCDGKRSAGRSLWFLPAPVRSDEPLRLSWRMDANQCIELRLERCDHDGTEPFVQRFDAPIMHRDPAQAVRARLLEREERIRNDRIAREDFGTAFEQHAHDCASLGEYEKALHYLSLAMQEQGERPELMIQRGIWRERMGNQAGAVESYQRAADCPSARFNLALLHHNAGRNDEALHWVDLALSGEPKRGYHALRGDILDRLGQREEARREWQDAIDGQPQLHELDDWSLGWMERAAAQIDNTAMRDKLRRHRAASREQDIEAPRQGELPARLDISSAQAA
jgi:tetratricopeptide (TPR) repeat protein